jgi:predicted CXXCH cytochrome family protein
MAGEASGKALLEESDAAPVAKPHDELSCKDCHKSHSMVPPEENSEPCIKCHEDQTGKNSHPTGVTYKGEMPPEKLPLSKDGKLTCSTCHILHETESPVPALLRKKFNDLCKTCHYPDRHPKGHDSHPKEHTGQKK